MLGTLVLQFLLYGKSAIIFTTDYTCEKEAVSWPSVCVLQSVWEKKSLESSDSVCPIVLQYSMIFSSSPLPLTIYSTIENIFLSELWLFDNANTLFFNSDFSHTKTHTWFYLLQGGANLHENRLMKHILHILMWDWACNGWSQIGITRYIHLYA